MSVASSVLLDEYLNTSYEPDCDYVDGMLEERNTGKYKHSRLQALLTTYLGVRESAWGIRVLTEQRIRVADRRVRIADVCALLDGQAQADVLDVPPFLCIEIWSQEDCTSRVMGPLNDYLAFGVPNVWSIDPNRERSYVVTPTGLTEARDNILRTSNPDIEVPVGELFERLR